MEADKTKLLYDKKCPECKNKKSKIWGHPSFHKERVCLECRKIYLPKNVQEQKSRRLRHSCSIRSNDILYFIIWRFTTMGIEQSKRIIWRLIETQGEKEYYLKGEIELAIIQEAGTHETTIKRHLNVLKKLGWFKISSKRYYLQKKDYF